MAEPITINAKDYISRPDLESFICAEIGQDISKNRASDNVIVGTRDELKQFGLSDTVSVFGIRVKITDTPISKILSDKKKNK